MAQCPCDVLRDSTARGGPTWQQRDTTGYGLVGWRAVWDREDSGSIPDNPTVTLAQWLEHPNVARRVAGSNPVRHPNFIHAPVAQLAEASDLGSGSSRFESVRGYARLAQWQRQRFQTPLSPGSSPGASTKPW